MSVATAPNFSLETLRKAVTPICESHPVSRLEVFGSRAEGTSHAGSDIDLLVEFLPDANAGLFEMGALQDALQGTLGLPRRPVEPAGSREEPKSVSPKGHPCPPGDALCSMSARWVCCGIFSIQ